MTIEDGYIERPGGGGINLGNSEYRYHEPNRLININIRLYQLLRESSCWKCNIFPIQVIEDIT